MWRAALRRIKVRTVQAVIGKRTAKTAIRLLAGKAGVEVFDRAFDFIQIMVGNNKEADKLVDKSFKILSEFSVLYAEKVISEAELEVMREQFEKICIRMEKFYKDQPELVDNKLDFTTASGKRMQVMTEDIITECMNIIIETVGHHFQASAIRKFREIAEKVSHPLVVAELCWINSPTNSILFDLMNKADRVIETIQKCPEGGEPWERLASSTDLLLLAGLEGLQIEDVPNNTQAQSEAP